MLTWSIANTTEASDVGKAIEVTAIRNWAAQLDDPLPLFFDLSPWDDTVPVNNVPQLVAELFLMETKMTLAGDGFPTGLEFIITTMLRLARRAAVLNRAIIIG
jgi:hypothetical protein